MVEDSAIPLGGGAGRCGEQRVQGDTASGSCTALLYMLPTSGHVNTTTLYTCIHVHV